MPGCSGGSRARIEAWVPALAAALFLSACGGSGGGEERGESSGVLYNQWGLRTIKADRAYARLASGMAPGSGQTLAAIDSGIDADHPVFAGKSVTESLLSGVQDETGDDYSHGTAVASVMVGHPDHASAEALKAPRGVAWGADIAMFAVPLGGGVSLSYEPISTTDLAGLDSTVAGWIGAVTGWSSGTRSIDFVNLSIGFEGIIEQYTGTELSDNFGDAIAALAQSRSTDKTVFVWAAGNAHGQPCDAADFSGNANLCVNGEVVAESVELLPGLPVRIPALRGHVIAVVAVGRDGGIASFSNRCGVAADWCIAAPGVRVRVAYFGPHPVDGTPGARGAVSASGTSAAAPMVTGGLAVMKHQFRDQMSNTALVARLFETANKSGIYAVQSVYGQGLMDLGAATAPVGTTMIALADRVGGPGDALAQTRFLPGGALGDGLALALSGHEIAAFDTLGAPFWFRLGDLAGAATGPSAAARLRTLMTPGEDWPPGALRPRFAPLAGGDRVSLDVMQASSAGAGGGHLALAGGALALRAGDRYGLRVAAFSTEGMERRAPATGATLSWRPDGGPLALTGGWVGERETMLASSAAGAFGRLSGASAFAGIEGRAQIGSWRLGAAAEIGTVKTAAHGGMISGVSPLTTSAFALRAERRLENGDGVTVSLAQPLRVEAGRARLSIPVGRTKDGRVLRRALTAGLAPSGRQIDIAAQWRRSLTKRGEMRLGAGWTRQPGHDATSRPDLTLFAGWRYAF